MFLTAAVMRFGKDRTAEFSVLGHLPILHYRAQEQTVHYLLIKQIPLSVNPDYLFTTEEISYGSGDLFILPTDGLTEVHNIHGEEFGIERIEQILKSFYYQQPEMLYITIINEVNNYGTQHDDQTLMIVRCY